MLWLVLKTSPSIFPTPQVEGVQLHAETGGLEARNIHFSRWFVRMRWLACFVSTVLVVAVIKVLEYLDVRDRLYDDTGKPRRICSIYVNEEDMRLLQGLNTPVKDGDTVTLTAAIAGG